MKIHTIISLCVLIKTDKEALKVTTLSRRYKYQASKAEQSHDIVVTYTLIIVIFPRAGKWLHSDVANYL